MHDSLETLLSRVQGKRLVVFDLDNTLMDETRYLFAGYEAVARVAAGNSASLARNLTAWLRDEFESGGRERLFERMAERYPAVRGTVEDWLSELRTVKVDLAMLPWVAPFCATVPHAAWAILTNGNAVQQRNKYHQLLPAELRDRMRLYCAAESKPKPSPAGLWRILEDAHCPPFAALMIGDTATDEACAVAAGVDFAWAPPV
jgi:FMN phosphatase YigB (HAD superfamily)